MKLLLLAACWCWAAFPQVAKEANGHYQTREGREAVARGLARPDRDNSQKPRELVAGMGLKPGMVVADLGTGVGYMLPFLSRAVGPGGRVLAEDIFDDFLEQASARATREKLENVTFIKGTEKDPKLPEGAVDVALALDSYHHYDYPAEMLAGIRRALGPGGRYVVVDYYRTAEAMANGFALQHIRINRDEVIKEIEAQGFRLVSSRDHVPKSQYMLVFEKN